MDLISELVHLIAKDPPRSLELMLPNGTKSRKLYDAVLEGRIVNDSDASQLIYNATEQEKKYLMLKRNLTRKLFELILIAPHSEINRTNYVFVQFECEKELTIARKLLIQNVYHNARKIALRVEKVARKLYLVELQLNCAKVLANIYSLEGNTKAAVKTHQHIKGLIQENIALVETRCLWEELYSETKHTLALTKPIADKALKYAQQIEQFLQQTSSPFVRMYYYRVLLFHYKHAQNPDMVLQTIQQFQKLLQDHPFVKTREIMVEIELELAIYYSNAKQLNQATQHINLCLKNTNYDTFDKFLMQTWHFDIQIRNENYTKALHICEEVKQTTQFQYLNPIDKAVWKMKEALLYLVVATKETPDKGLSEYTASYEKQYSHADFIHVCSATTKDKKGYNIIYQYSDLLMQLAFHNHDFDAEGNKMMVYYYRHLKNQSQQRTRYFFYHMSKLASVNFSKDEAQKRAELFKEDIANIPGQYDLCEWIPYEVLWNVVLSMVKSPVVY